MDAFKNFAISDVSAGYASGATSIVLATGGGAKFPAPPFNAVWWDTTYPDPSSDPGAEIVRVTNVATDTLTITRAQEGTANANHNTGGRTYRLIAPLTAETLNAITAVLDAITAAARTVLDDATVAAMVDTLGGASASGTGGLARTTDPELVRPAISGTPAVAGALGYDSAKGTTTQYSGVSGSVGWIPRVVASGVGTETLINSTTGDQDWTSVYTIPANTLIANKSYRVTLLFELITGTSSVTTPIYLKLGSTKVVTSVGTNLNDGLTRSLVMQYFIWGRAAASGAANISAAYQGDRSSPNVINSTNQPVSVATNGTLAITPGVAYSGTGSTESIELQAWLVEELN